jgi:hypothetical protein
VAKYRIKVTTTGTAGDATGVEETPELSGIAHRIAIAYHADAPATTDVVVKHIFANGIEETLANVVDNNSDVIITARVAETDETGADLGSTTPPMIAGTIEVTVTGCDALTDAVDVVIVAF